MRTLLNSVRVVSIDLSIRRLASSRNSSMVGISSPFRGVEMIVPTCSPVATRRMLPSASSKTWIGSAFSMQSESAVVSITRSPRSIASRWVSAGRKVAAGSVRGSPS